MNITLIAAALRALAEAIEAPGIALADQPTASAPTGKPRGRPVKAETAPVVISAAAVNDALLHAAAVSPAITAAQPGVALPAATPAVAATANLTHAQLAPLFLASAKAHKREFVMKCMKKFSAEAFDKVPVAKLPEFKAMLEAGPQPETEASVDVRDLMG